MKWAPSSSPARHIGLVMLTFLLSFMLIAASPDAVAAQPGMVLSHKKISDTTGGFLGTLDDDDRMGNAIAPLGDFDGDGIEDIAVGSPGDDDGGTNCGAVWLMFLNSNGSVKSHAKISADSGGFGGQMDSLDGFSRVATLHDFDGDGVTDLAVGSPRDDDGGPNRGAVWILFLNANGTVKEHRKISDTSGGFGGILDDYDVFGWSVIRLPDLDGDGIPELAVGASSDDDGGPSRGAVWILFMNADGTVKAHQKISDTQGGFTGGLADRDNFGYSVASLGDLDQDGVGDLAVGAYFADGGGTDRGEVWILFLNRDGTVKAHQEISDAAGGFTGVLIDFDYFGRVAELPDIDGDHVRDLAVGAPGDDDGPGEAGAVWILFLNRDGTVKGHQKISSSAGGFAGTLHNGDFFGFAPAFVGDVSGDGRVALAVGALFEDVNLFSGPDRGAVWMLFLDGPVLTAAPEGASSSVVSLASSPNPFGGRAALQYALPTAGAVRLVVVDSQGRRVATLVDGEQSAGPHSATWSGRNDDGAPATAGVYFARLETAGETAVRKIVLVK